MAVCISSMIIDTQMHQATYSQRQDTTLFMNDNYINYLWWKISVLSRSNKTDQAHQKFMLNSMHVNFICGQKDHSSKNGNHQDSQRFGG